MRLGFRIPSDWWTRINVAHRAASYALKNSESSNHLAVGAHLSSAGKWAASANAAGLIVALTFISSAVPYLFDGDCVSVVGNLNIIKTAGSFDAAFSIGALSGLCAISIPSLFSGMAIASIYLETLLRPTERDRALIFASRELSMSGAGAVVLQTVFVALSIFCLYIGIKDHAQILKLFRFDNLVNDYKSGEVEKCKRELIPNPDLTSTSVQLPQPLLPGL